MQFDTVPRRKKYTSKKAEASMSQSLRQSGTTSTSSSTRTTVVKPSVLPPPLSTPLSSFYATLTKPYTPMPTGWTPAPPSFFAKRDGGEARTIVPRAGINIHQSRGQAEVSDDDDNIFVEPDDDLDGNLPRPIYESCGPWAWARGHDMKRTHILKQLARGAMCVASIKSSYLNGREVTYVSRGWLQRERRRWQGFYSELALYKSQHYMASLQGDVIPRLIGVYVDVEAVNLAMELPHHCFWMEASTDMPIVLKERCIEAFEKIHAKGVLHNDVELRHMLIGGDGKVTIIDFQESYAMEPNPDVMLKAATLQDFALEMRKVKFKLDYNRARQREHEKYAREEAREKLNAINSEEGKAEIPPLPEDAQAPPPSKAEWATGWARIDMDETPRRFIVPGQTKEQFEDALLEFHAIVHRMTVERAALLERNRLFGNLPPVFNTEIEVADRRAAQLKQIVADKEKTPAFAESTGSRKRKVSASDDAGPPPKRVHTTTGDAAYTPAPLDADVMQLALTTPLPTMPRLIEHGTKALLSGLGTYDIRTTSYGCDASLLPASSSTTTSRDPIPRDFIDAPYDGPKAYYFPHPPTENRMHVHRLLYIRQKNILKCFDQGLPYNGDDIISGEVRPPHFHRSSRGIDRGALKRKRDAKDLDLAAERAAMHKAKKSKYMEAKANDIELDNTAFPDAYLDLRVPEEGPRILTKAEFSKLPPPSKVRKGILMPSHRDIMQDPEKEYKSISYAREDWMDEGDLTLSPKLGPIALPISRTEPRAILCATVDDRVRPAKAHPEDNDDRPGPGFVILHEPWDEDPEPSSSSQVSGSGSQASHVAQRNWDSARGARPAHELTASSSSRLLQRSYAMYDVTASSNAATSRASGAERNRRGALRYEHYWERPSRGSRRSSVDEVETELLPDRNMTSDRQPRARRDSSCGFLRLISGLWR